MYLSNDGHGQRKEETFIPRERERVGAGICKRGWITKNVVQNGSTYITKKKSIGILSKRSS